MCNYVYSILLIKNIYSLCIIISYNIVVLQNHYLSIHSEVKTQKPLITLSIFKILSDKFIEMKMAIELFLILYSLYSLLREFCSIVVYFSYQRSKCISKSTWSASRKFRDENEFRIYIYPSTS